MKKISILASVLLFVVMGVSAQNSGESRGSVKMDWSQPFTAVRVQGPVRLVMSPVAEDQPMNLSHSAMENSSSRLKFTVDKQGVLHVVERGLRGSADTTEMHLCYRTLERLTVEGANVRFDRPLEQQMFDLEVSGGAVVDLPIETMDAVVKVTGKCSVKLSGNCRYLDLKVSTALIDATKLKSASIYVDATHHARVSLGSTERLSAQASQAQVTYLTEPEILRTTTSFGGKVLSLTEAALGEAADSAE